MQVWHSFVFDDVRGENVDDEDNDEDEGLDVEGLGTHL